MVVAERKILSIVADRPYFIKDNFVLYHSDSINILNQLAENSIDMIFADPPYNLSNGGFSVHAGRMVSVNKGYWDVSRGFQDDYAFHYRWLEACKRVLKPHGTLWVRHLSLNLPVRTRLAVSRLSYFKRHFMV